MLFWNNIFKLNPDYKVKIVFESNDLAFIKRKEIRLIKLIGRRNLKLGSLVNFTNGGDGVFGLIFTKEHRDKISKTKKFRPKTLKQIEAHKRMFGRKIKHSDSWKENNSKVRRKSILQFTLEDVFIKEWKGAIEVQEILGFSRKNISSCLRNKSKTAYGYKWKFKN